MLQSLNYQAVNPILEQLQTLEIKLDALSNELRTHTPKDLLTSRETAKYLNIKMNWLNKLCSQDKISYTRPGGKARFFKKSDLDAYLKKNLKKSDDELDREADEMLFGNSKNLK